MTKSEHLCLSCGLCCDGTLIGFVELSKKEIPAIKNIMEVEELYGNGIFLHPCKKYCNGCTVYEHRPENCAKFKCGLLKAHEQNEINFKNASIIINDVKVLKNSIEIKINDLKIKLKSPSFYFKMVELNKILIKKQLDKRISIPEIDLKQVMDKLENILLDNFKISMY
jgi:Fe-S-cluster containining protein